MKLDVDKLEADVHRMPGDSMVVSKDSMLALIGQVRAGFAAEAQLAGLAVVGHVARALAA